MTEKLKKSDEQWREQLSPEEYSVARQAGTERAFSGRYWDCKDDGTYCCLCCGQELFKSDAKFDSGTGWPSFDRAVNAGAVEVREDMSMGMMRTEVVCSGCDAHLGHVFPDGPPTTGERYCMNSASLKLRLENEA
jgi:peptide-methionine (R)-S-oxide reductase